MSPPILKNVWYIIRQDTHGKEYLFDTKKSEEEANDIAKEHNEKGHHQGYWVTQTLPKNIIR